MGKESRRSATQSGAGEEFPRRGTQVVIDVGSKK